MGFELINNLINQRFTFIFKWWLVIQSQKVLYHYPLTYWDQGSFKQDLCNIDKKKDFKIQFLRSCYIHPWCLSWVESNHTVFKLIFMLHVVVEYIFIFYKCGWIAFNAVKNVSLHSSASPTLLVTDQTMRFNSYKNHYHQKRFYCRVWNGPLMKLFCCRIHTWSKVILFFFNLIITSCFGDFKSTHIKNKFLNLSIDSKNLIANSVFWVQIFSQKELKSIVFILIRIYRG